MLYALSLGGVPWSKVDKGDREANEKAVGVLFDCLDRYLLNNAEER